MEPGGSADDGPAALTPSLFGSAVGGTRALTTRQALPKYSFRMPLRPGGALAAGASGVLTPRASGAPGGPGGPGAPAVAFARGLSSGHRGSSSEELLALFGSAPQTAPRTSGEEAQPLPPTGAAITIPTGARRVLLPKERSVSVRSSSYTAMPGLGAAQGLSAVDGDASSWGPEQATRRLGQMPRSVTLRTKSAAEASGASGGGTPRASMAGWYSRSSPLGAGNSVKNAAQAGGPGHGNFAPSSPPQSVNKVAAGGSSSTTTSDDLPGSLDVSRGRATDLDDRAPPLVPGTDAGVRRPSLAGLPLAIANGAGSPAGHRAVGKIGQLDAALTASRGVGLGARLDSFGTVVPTPQQKDQGMGRSQTVGSVEEGGAPKAAAHAKVSGGALASQNNSFGSWLPPPPTGSPPSGGLPANAQQVVPTPPQLAPSPGPRRRVGGRNSVPEEVLLGSGVAPQPASRRSSLPGGVAAASDSPNQADGGEGCGVDPPRPAAPAAQGAVAPPAQETPPLKGRDKPTATVSAKATQAPASGAPVVPVVVAPAGAGDAKSESPASRPASPGVPVTRRRPSLAQQVGSALSRIGSALAPRGLAVPTAQ